MGDSDLERRIAAVRQFNRAYTQRIGVLDEGYLDTPFSLTQGRVLYELAEDDGVRAKDIADKLALDPGYLSRMLRAFQQYGLIESRRAAADGRRKALSLTPAGRAELDRWLNEPAIPARGYRDDFFLKIMAAVRSGDPATLSSVLSRQRACLLRQLHALAEARALHHDYIGTEHLLLGLLAAAGRTPRGDFTLETLRGFGIDPDQARQRVLDELRRATA